MCSRPVGYSRLVTAFVVASTVALSHRVCAVELRIIDGTKIAFSDLRDLTFAFDRVSVSLGVNCRLLSRM